MVLKAMIYVVSARNDSGFRLQRVMCVFLTWVKIRHVSSLMSHDQVGSVT